MCVNNCGSCNSCLDNVVPIPQGPAGPNGINGINGDDGADGADGASAYEIAVANGFEGTEEEWLTSLNGTNGANGIDGLSAYEIAVDNGFEGTEEDWLNSLEGSSGGTTYAIGDLHPSGGYVFYTWDDGAHGLVVSNNLANPGSPNLYWADPDAGDSGAAIISSFARGSGIGAGEMNTPIIVATEANRRISATDGGAILTAAYLCSVYNHAGATVDLCTWYLGSAAEWVILNTNLVSLPTLLSDEIILDGTYWTSTEVNATSAIRFNLSGGGISQTVSKDTQNKVRPFLKF